MPFQRFEPRVHRAVPARVRTERGLGRFVLNHAAHSSIGEPPYVEMAFDPARLRIGFIPKWERTPSTFTCSKLTQRGTGCKVTAQSFGRAYGINPDRPATYAAVVEEGMLVIDLNSEALQPSKTPPVPADESVHRDQMAKAS